MNADRLTIEGWRDEHIKGNPLRGNDELGGPGLVLRNSPGERAFWAGQSPAAQFDRPTAHARPGGFPYPTGSGPLPRHRVSAYRPTSLIRLWSWATRFSQEFEYRPAGTTRGNG
jgi:hypothetical protein